MPHLNSVTVLGRWRSGIQLVLSVGSSVITGLLEPRDERRVLCGLHVFAEPGKDVCELFEQARPATA